jgi:RNA polymerase sigma-70 factor (ECF subfamily)
MKPGGAADVRTLVEQHYEMLYRYAYRLAGSAADAEDLTQETFCTAQEKFGQLRDAGAARSWLFTILRNHYLHRRRSDATVSIQSLDGLECEPEVPAELAADVDSERLQAVLDDLPEAFRTPLVLFYFEELSYRQIAEQLRVPVGTVMSRLARAKAYLRYRLRPHVAAPLNPASPGVA